MHRLAPAAIIAAALAGTITAPADAAPAPRLVSVRVPLTGTITAGAGNLTLNGTIQLIIQPQDPVFPTDPVRPARVLTVVLARATSPNLSCRILGADTFRLADATTPFVGSYRFQPVDPVRPNDPCRALAPLNVDYKLTFSGTGAITGATAVALDPE